MANPAPPLYRERLYPSFWVWVLLLAGVLAFAIVGARFGAGWALFSAALAAVLLMWATVRSTATVEVADGELRAGRAHIPLALLGEATALDAKGMVAQRGPGLDARAYLCLRGWVGGGVRVNLQDPRDPAPYWLVSSRRPQALAAAVNANV